MSEYVTGIEDVVSVLLEFPDEIATKALPKGLRAAGNVIRAELRRRTPEDPAAVGNRAHGGKGSLKSTIKMQVITDPRVKDGVVRVGFWELGHLAGWVEYGHRIVGRHSRNERGKIVTRGGYLGDVKPHPFMRPAADASEQAAVEAFYEAVREALKGISSAA